jgi:hypothetical protein
MDVMRDFPHPWWISGGWTVDLALGRITRPHDDIDICVLREDTQAVLDYFSDWDIGVTIPGEHRLEPVCNVDDTLAPRYGLHLHKDALFLEILLTDKVDDEIPFRRQPSIRMPVTQFSQVDALNRPYVAPEFQLLFKAKDGREKDEQDFLAYLPLMTVEQRAWLLAALQAHLPNSPWIPRLESDS